MMTQKMMVAAAVHVAVVLLGSVGANYVIFSQRFSADPAPLVHDGRVYLYTSHDKDHNHGFDMTDYNCLSSTDLVNWRDEGIAFSMNDTTWAKGLNAWAQQVVKLKNGTFVMYFPAMGSGGGVGVASATSPAGPYVTLDTQFPCHLFPYIRILIIPRGEQVCPGDCWPAGGHARRRRSNHLCK